MNSESRRNEEYDTYSYDFQEETNDENKQVRNALIDLNLILKIYLNNKKVDFSDTWLHDERSNLIE